MLDRKKVVIEQGLYKGGHGQEPISVEDMKLNSTSNNTSKTDKTGAATPTMDAYTQP